ncbi:MAG: hypothetical protein JWL76_432 [Thermoleophilia bacterium]|nr:hypothetical protein [Thermoleophilia bacterium]
MQHVVDYIRQNAAAYPREMIDAQLRQTGYAESDIHAAWGAAYAAPVAGQTATAVAVMGGGPVAGPIAIAGDGTPWYQSTYMRIVMVIVSVIAAYGAFGEFTDGPKKISSKELLTKMEQHDTDGSLETLSGDARGKLPSGWSKVKDGLWADLESGNSVSVMTASREGLNLKQVTMGATETLKLQGADLRGGAKVVRFQDRDAYRIQLVQASPKGAKMLVTQYYVSHGGDMTVVTMGYAEDASDEVRDEVQSVADAIKLPA